jgi:hypothetical protein
VRATGTAHGSWNCIMKNDTAAVLVRLLASLRRGRQTVARGALHTPKVRIHVQKHLLAVPAAWPHASPATARCVRFALLLLASAPAHAGGNDWTVGGEASLRHDSNVGNAQAYSDVVDDTIVGARLAVFQLYPLGGSYSLTVGGDLAGEVFHQITGLNNASADAVVTLKKKWGLGAFAPWTSAGFSLGRSSYADAYRNAWEYHATVAAGQRIDARWNLWAEYDFDRRAARTQEEEVPGLSGDAYSSTGHTLRVSTEYAVGERTFLNLALSVRRGDVISTSEENLQIFYASKAIAEDPAFGDEEYAYRITGTTYGISVGIAFSPTAHSALGLSFARFETHAEGGNDYTKSLPEITWNYRF